MEEKIVHIGREAKLVFTKYDYKEDDVCLEYSEKQSDPWYGNIEESIYIDKAKAIELVELLREAFNI